jgi:outer membrane receptor protein involved in Fe transport
MPHLRFILLFLAFTPVIIQAQNRTQRSITGIVLEAETGNPLEFANVTLKQLPDSSFLGGTITDAKGRFTLDAKPGNLLVGISFAGFEKTEKVTRIEKSQTTVNLGKIALRLSNYVLDEAVIEGERSQVSLTLEKKTFEVGQDLASIGGSATDVLENVPSVTVDAEGNVSLRGSGNVRILIDGRQSGMVALSAQDALQMLPADMIERVEVITNPSARYDAEGMAGIINIITKKEKKKGTNGTLSLTAGEPRNYQASLNLNHRTGNWNFFGGYGYRNSAFAGFSNEDRTTMVDDSISFVTQRQDRNRSRESHSLQGGVEYRAGQYNLITLNGSWRQSIGDNRNTVEYTFADDQGLYGTGLRYNVEEENRVSTDWSLNYTRTFPEKDKKLMVDFSYTASDETEDTDAEQYDVTTTGRYNQGEILYQHSLNKENVNNVVFQADFIDPVGEKGKFEAGIKSSFRIISSDYMVEERSDFTQDWVVLPNVTNALTYNEIIHAGYVMYSQAFDKFSFAAGVRTEYTDILIEQQQLGTEDRKEYINPFPTIHLSYAFNKFESVQLSYSRRINRPGFWELNPFYSYDNPLSFRSGNPDLDPEFTNSLELGYLVFKDKWNVNPAVYVRHTTGVIQRIQFVQDGVTISRPENANTQLSYGIELTGTYKPWKWWTLNGTINGYGAQLDGTNIQDGAQRDFFTYTVQASSMMRLPKDINVQLRGNYEAEQETAQGRRLSIWRMDLAITKDFWDKRANASFKIQDVFNSRIRRSESSGADFQIYQEGRWRPRMFIIGFTYRLNPNERDTSRGSRDFDGGGE